mmetsp:Transcript_54020/g.123116  ORF Transcript_54020/g.123116 Transcript_54020/m.123116 type:complete len:299 (-) Transcript_54020:374-1270(-)
MKSKKRKPIPIVPPKMKSLKRARHVTSSFHRITHAIERIESSARPDQAQLCALRRELHELGGRDAYQQASVLTTARCSSSSWVIKTLRRLGRLTGAKKPEASDLRVLEVGAINTELLTTRGLEVRAIDLLAQDPKIEKRDVFELEKEEGKQYDVIVCSMVINCIPTAQDRGRMLTLLRRLLRDHGLLFLTLPISCLTPPGPAAAGGKKTRAVPGFDRAAFESLLRQAGFEARSSPDSKTSEKVRRELRLKVFWSWHVETIPSQLFEDLLLLKYNHLAEATIARDSRPSKRNLQQSFVA